MSDMMDEFSSPGLFIDLPDLGLDLSPGLGIKFIHTIDSNTNILTLF